MKNIFRNLTVVLALGASVSVFAAELAPKPARKHPAWPGPTLTCATGRSWFDSQKTLQGSAGPDITSTNSYDFNSVKPVEFMGLKFKVGDAITGAGSDSIPDLRGIFISISDSASKLSTKLRFEIPTDTIDPEQTFDLTLTLPDGTEGEISCYFKPST